LFASRLLESMLRPMIEDAGRLLRMLLLRLGLAGGRELEARLRVLRPGVEVVQFLGEKVAAGVIVAITFPLMNLLHIEPLGAWPVWLWLVGFGLGFGLPDVDLDRRARLRRGQVLPAHAQALRERQRLHIVEEGGKASVRMLLPVALLILPALFVVVLVPAAAELTRLGG